MILGTAKTEEEARGIHPSGHDDPDVWKYHGGWASSPKKVKVELLGEAIEGTSSGVILGSFNAG